MSHRCVSEQTVCCQLKVPWALAGPILVVTATSPNVWQAAQYRVTSSYSNGSQPSQRTLSVAAYSGARTWLGFALQCKFGFPSAQMQCRYN